MNFANDEKLKAYLKKESKRLGITITNTYNTFFSFLLLERINKLSYDKLCVKGSFCELVHLDQIIRPVIDIDLVSSESHNNPLITLYKAMYDSNDDLFFELTDIPKTSRTGIYKIHLTVNFGKIKHPLSIDFQELSKTIYEKEYKSVNSIFVGGKSFYVYVPSYEEHFAEKLCIITESNKDDVLNTRVKDFYDIYKLLGGKYDKERLSYFFYHMLKDRNKIDINSASVNHINQDFIDRHKCLWEPISKKYEFMDKSIKFEDAVLVTKNMLKEEIENLDKSKKLQITLR